MIKKLFLTFILSILMTFAFSQQYQSGRYYAYAGSSSTRVSYQTEWNPYMYRYENIKYCRTLNWYQQQYSGYVYYYGPNGWYAKWESGYFWYCTWTGWYKCF
jgi:hypothetical protein